MAHQSVLAKMLGLVLVIIIWAAPASASWLTYHKPEFCGQIIDQEAKQGIEGAAVVALYRKWTMGIGAGGSQSIIHVRETITDKDGKFCIPSYTTLIAPFSTSDRALFIIYKPGHVGIDSFNVFDFEGLFSGRYPSINDKSIPWILDNKFIITIEEPNIVQLPRLTTREDRIKAHILPFYDDKTWNEQKYLIQLIREEYKYLFDKDPNQLYTPKN